MKHWLLSAALICFGSAVAQAAPNFDSCSDAFAVEQQALSTTAAVEVSTAAASNMAMPARRWLCVANLDSTAANHVWVSSFQVTSLVSGVLDTAKSWPIPGGNTADAKECFPFGNKIRVWLHRVIGTSKAAVRICQ